MTAERGASPTAGEAEGRPARGRRHAHSFGGALGLTVLGAVVPGTAFLAARRRVVGALTLLVFLALVGGAAWLATAGRRTAVHIAVNTGSLLWVIGLVAAVGLLWVLAIVVQYLVVTPARTRPAKHLLGGFLVLVLAAGVALPAYEVIHLADVQRGLVNGVFARHQQSATVVDTPDPFGARDRVNVLLLGGDSGPGRDGTRTDTVIVASIDTHTGDTTLFSLPRNLENLPFPPGSPLAALYPNGFTAAKEDEGLLNAVYRNGPALHPGVLGPTDNEGADWLKLGVGQALGLHIDYYVLVNLEGFSRLVDTLGGITVNINYWVPVNGIPDSNVLPDDYLTPGPDQHLNGFQALQFARGRFGLTDYDRMARQRCAINAIIAAADPVTLLSQYQELARTTQDTVRTDIPQSALSDFVDLAFTVKDASVRSVVFDNTLINSAYPDYDKIRAIVAGALASPATAAPTSPSTAPTTGGEAPPPATSPVTDVSNACAYNPAQAQAALAQGKPPIRGG
jgi:polyisoprenyl-teichoic acid--peptidoglycan teichoic acid transferase